MSSEFNNLVCSPECHYAERRYGECLGTITNDLHNDNEYNAMPYKLSRNVL
jgi:hypothetical protein